MAVADYAAYRHPDARLIFVTATSFFSDGSIFAMSPNVCAFLPARTPPEDLAAVVEFHGNRAPAGALIPRFQARRPALGFCHELPEPSASPEAVIFDIGNVLIEWQPEARYDAHDRARPPRGDVCRRRSARDERADRPRRRFPGRDLRHRRALPGVPRRDPDVARPLARSGPAGDRPFGAAAQGVARRPACRFSRCRISGPAVSPSAERDFPFLPSSTGATSPGHMGVTKPDARIYEMVEADCGIAPDAAPVRRRPGREHRRGRGARAGRGTCSTGPGLGRATGRGRAFDRSGGSMSIEMIPFEAEQPARLGRADRGAGGRPPDAKAPRSATPSSTASPTRCCSRSAWIDGMGIAVKTATVFPDNPGRRASRW